MEEPGASSMAVQINVLYAATVTVVIVGGLCGCPTRWRSRGDDAGLAGLGPVAASQTGGLMVSCVWPRVFSCCTTNSSFILFPFPGQNEPSHGKPKRRCLADHLICENYLFLLPDVLLLTHLHKHIRDTGCRCFCFSAQDSRFGHAEELAIHYIICVD